MEKRESKVEIPKGVEVLADIGSGLLIVRADVNVLREQDKNAHLMKPEMFRQLHENIKKRGTLESLPFLALTSKGVEIISGHHRVRASKEAGLKSIPAILDITNLNRSQIAAKQIAHNAINGFDDKSVLKEIAALIDDVDDMIESYIGKDILGEPEGTLDKLISPMLDYDWQDMQFIFLPHQVRDLELLVTNVEGNKDYTGAAHIDQFEGLLSTLSKYQKFSDIKNVGAAIHKMIEIANEVMDNAGFDENEEWVPLSKVFGNAAIPVEVAERVKTVIDALEKDEKISKHRKWEGLSYVFDLYENQNQ